MIFMDLVSPSFQSATCGDIGPVQQERLRGLRICMWTTFTLFLLILLCFEPLEIKGF